MMRSIPRKWTGPGQQLAVDTARPPLVALSQLTTMQTVATISGQPRKAGESLDLLLRRPSGASVVV
mgnify:CR=1 FL=1